MSMLGKGVTRERLEGAMIGLAQLVDGKYPELLPLLERLEKDYALLRRPPESERIRKLIADARKEDGLD